MKAWHYTTGDHVVAIKASGVLKTSTGLVPNMQKPVLWFSLNHCWEQTANKCWSDGMGNTRGLDMAETGARCGGPVRIGIEAEGLLRSDQLRHAADIGRVWWRDLCSIGIKNVASPDDWLGHVGELVGLGPHARDFGQRVAGCWRTNKFNGLRASASR